MEAAVRIAEPTDPRRDRTCLAILLWVLLALGFTTIQVHQSLYAGRLAAPPTYDDVAYLSDAQARLHTLYTAGPAEVVREALDDPPHSPWSTGLATLAFMTLGVREWAPAAANGLIILLLLLGLSWRARDLPLAWKLPIAVFLLTWPLAGQAVVNFRPDIACGLATAWTALYIAGRPWVTARHRRHYLAGAGLALALLIKPTVSPMTVCVVLVALAATTLTDIALGRERRDWRPILRAWSRCLGLAMVLAGPYYLQAGHEIVEYVVTNSYGELKDIWQLDLSGPEHALYYLTGPAGKLLLDAWLYLWLGLAVATASLAFAGRDRGCLARVPAATAVFLVTWLFISIPGHKNEFLGAALPALMLISAMEMLIYVSRTSRSAAAVWPRRAGALVLIALAGAGTALFGWPDRFAGWSSPEPQVVRQHRELLERIYHGVIQSGPRPTRVLFTHIGPYLNPPLLRFRSGLDRRGQVDSLDIASIGSLDGLAPHLDAATDVIIFSPDNPNSISWLPAAGIQRQVREHVEAHPHFVLGQAFSTPGSGQVFLFKRTLGFRGLRPLEGLGPREGPYPEMGLDSEVMWGLGPGSLLEMEVAPGATVRLILEGSSSLPEQAMTVLVSGLEVGAHTFAERGEFELVDLTLSLPPGRHPVEIRYSSWRSPDENDNRRLAVLFRTMLAVQAASPR